VVWAYNGTFGSAARTKLESNADGNGIPLNDGGVPWRLLVNMLTFASSSWKYQIQRGVPDLQQWCGYFFGASLNFNGYPPGRGLCRNRQWFWLFNNLRNSVKAGTDSSINRLRWMHASPTITSTALRESSFPDLKMLLCIGSYYGEKRGKFNCVFPVKTTYKAGNWSLLISKLKQTERIISTAYDNELTLPAGVIIS